MTMIDKKYSKDNDPEIPKDRIIDALRAGNKLSAAMATDIANMKIGIHQNKRAMGASHQQVENVIVADYGHGLLTKKLINTIQKKSKKLAINTQLNSANFGFHTISKYHKANIVCVHEGEIRQDLRSPDKNIEELAIELSKKNIFKKYLHYTGI